MRDSAEPTSAPKAKTLADYKGDVVLLNIWATWCAPCRAEMPSIERLHREFGPRGLKIVAVSVDDPGQQKTVRDFAREVNAARKAAQAAAPIDGLT